MNRSSKFNFFLPQNTDPIEVSDFNSNFETIDANLLTKAQSLTSDQKAAVRANVDLNVANNLTTDAAGSVLDARQGKALVDLLTKITTVVDARIASNANDAKEGGTWYLLPSATNKPTTDGYYILSVRVRNTSNVAQTAVEINDGRVYVRTFHDGSTWTSWEELVRKSDVNARILTIPGGKVTYRVTNTPRPTSILVLSFMAAFLISAVNESGDLSIYSLAENPQTGVTVSGRNIQFSSNDINRAFTVIAPSSCVFTLQ